MGILRFQIILIVFMVLQETLNKEIDSKNDLNDHGINESVLNNTAVVENQSQKKHITEPFNRDMDLNALNTGKGYLVIRPVMKKQPFFLYTPRYNFKYQPINNGLEVSETALQSTQIEENNLIVDKTEEIKANEVISHETQILKEKEEKNVLDTEKDSTIDKELPNNLENPLKEFISDTNEPDIVKKNTNKKVHHHHRNCPKCRKSKNDADSSRKNSDNSLADEKLANTPNPQSIDERSKFTKENRLEENFNIVENDKFKNIIKVKEDQVVSLKPENEAKPKRHPFLDAIHNDRYITSNADITPIMKEVKDLGTLGTNTDIKDENEFKYFGKFSSLADEVKSLKESDDSEYIVIKNNDLQDVTEVSEPTAISLEGETQNDVPFNYENYIQAPYYQIPRNYYYGNNNYNPKYGTLRFAQKQTVPTKDGSSFISYNNFKTSACYPYNVYPYNKIYYYGYPNQNQVGWRSINDQTNYNMKNGIWRFWKNIEYYINKASQVRI